ncbi:hypothetical protein Flexsi_2171 [Flexistipes sinusarabici DSM 4947]|uniref:Lipoprotein n=1 Tax=Flexistipes sinusarabici (strain ATCC 49648 / DSM 4947 / MAS 10) TaxID=717231 RepID=F8E5V2_FLESM|nr:hypothetical protein [Flexistipes sinusarabici]AEI15793.1 hypothetical protein Flexsi_2171 [Flexistipes sinusarabici DSM 4947]
MNKKYLILLIFVISIFIFTGCAVNLDNVSPKLQKGESFKTARMKYTWHSEEGTLKIIIKNTSFEPLLKSELYVRFYRNKNFIKGINKRTFALETSESETLEFKIPAGTQSALVHYREYDPRDGGGHSDDFDGEFDYFDFGYFLIRLR